MPPWLLARQVNDGDWRSIQGVDLYPHSGGFIDSVWDLHGILGYTYEGSSIQGGKSLFWARLRHCFYCLPRLVDRRAQSQTPPSPS